MDPRGSPPWFGAITVRWDFSRNRWPRGCRKFEFWGMVNCYGFAPIFWTQWDPIGPKMDPMESPPWFGAITVMSDFGRNRWPRGCRKFEFWGMVVFYDFDPFFGPNGTPLAPIWPLGVPTVIWRHNRKVGFWPKSMTAGLSKIRILGHCKFLRFWPIFWTQWDPIGPNMALKGSPPWFGAITLRSDFRWNRWPRGSRKFEFWGMVIFYGFDPFFGPNGTPLAPRWTLGGPHRDLAP